MRERRAHQRHVVDLPTHIVVNGQGVACRLVDMSRGGALVEAPVPVTVGERVLLDLPDQGRVIATIVRTTPVSFALAFAGTVILSKAGDDDADDDIVAGAPRWPLMAGVPGPAVARMAPVAKGVRAWRKSLRP